MTLSMPPASTASTDIRPEAISYTARATGHLSMLSMGGWKNNQPKRGQAQGASPLHPPFRVILGQAHLAGS
jgi:hypothetical protein